MVTGVIPYVFETVAIRSSWSQTQCQTTDTNSCGFHVWLLHTKKMEWTCCWYSAAAPVTCKIWLLETFHMYFQLLQQVHHCSGLSGRAQTHMVVEFLYGCFIQGKWHGHVVDTVHQHLWHENYGYWSCFMCICNCFSKVIIVPDSVSDHRHQ